MSAGVRATPMSDRGLDGPALFADENLLSLVICRMANLSLEHGNSEALLPMFGLA